MKDIGWHFGDFLKGVDTDRAFIFLASVATALIVFGLIFSGVLSPTTLDYGPFIENQ